MTAPDMSGAQQMEQPDVRGWLAINGLPPEYQRSEDSTTWADRERAANRWQRKGFQRPATDTERALLAWLGHGPLPDELVTHVRYYSKSCRNRTWPQIEAKEAES